MRVQACAYDAAMSRRQPIRAPRSRPPFDAVITAIADYAAARAAPSELALETAFYCLMDTLGCAFRGAARTRHAPSCSAPWCQARLLRGGARVPGHRL